MVAVTAAVTATAAGGNVGGPSVLNISVNTRLASSVTIRATTKHVASDRPLAARTSSANPGRLPKNAKQRSVSAHANASQKNISQTTRSDGGNSRSTLDDASSRSAPMSESTANTTRNASDTIALIQSIGRRALGSFGP